jgi:glucose/mannose transport system substrate-binding protein
MVSDSFAMPKGAHHPQAARKWLAECASVDGQDLFNPLKGSIPARVDADRAKYKEYLATSMADWQNPDTTIVGSLTHGVVANNEWNAEIDEALAALISGGDTQGFGEAVVKSYEATR